MNNEPALLFVEDSKTLTALALRTFEQFLPYRTITAASFAQTVELVESQDYDFVWAVADLTLPDASGEEVIDYLIQARIRPIVLTGTFGEEWRQLMLAKNIVDYYLKQGQGDYELVAEQILRLDNNRNITVLVVDDSISYRAYLSRLLKNQNYKVIQANSGEEALKKLEKYPEIQLMITDYLMEGLNGVELVSTARKIYKPSQLAIIGISASEELMLSPQFLKAGATDYLSKPFSTEEFNCRISQNIQRMDQFETLQKALDIQHHFLGIAAHDLRNPIGSIQGFCKLFLNGLFGHLSEEQRLILSRIQNTTDHTLNLLDNLLDISAIESGKLTLNPVEVELSALLKDIVSTQIFHARQKQIEILCDLATVPRVWIDPLRLQQVLENLLSNALKYSQPQSQVHLRLFLEQERIVIEVEDQGLGLEPEEQQRLFLPFQKLKTRPTAGESSTGLGLAIVKKIVDEHKWQISCQSIKGVGTTFCLTIPLTLEGEAGLRVS